jgi:two-component system cell cycle sensor histidine kinase/response regulator CckA
VFDLWMDRGLSEGADLRADLEIIAKGGKHSILEVNARPVLDNGRMSSIEGIARDVTRRKEMEAALRESEERFSSAFRVSPVAIAIVALEESRFELVNESFLRFLKYRPEEVIGYTASDLGIWLSQEERVKVDLTLKEHNSVSGVECHFRTKTGETRTALVFMEQLAMAHNPCALFCAFDMTERLNLESQLRQAQKMEAIGRLAAGVAHDFNNLLTVIQGNIELSRMKSQITPELDRSMEQVSNAAQKAAGLVRQLLTFSRKQVMQPTQLDLNVLISSSTKMLKHLLTSDIHLKLGFAPNLSPLFADATMIEQVVMNLVVNARDAMPKGGEITICTTLVEVDQAYLQQHPDAIEGKSICLSVTDSGCGMDAATQARVFEPFFTTKDVDKGTGLGLATVYGVVKQHSGWIELHSVVGRGTTFKMFFPLDQNLGQQTATAEKKRKLDGPPTILVVEDDLAVGEFVRATLQDSGFQVLTATSALEAMETWNDHRGVIDVLFTDLVMPKGMTGMELAANLKALRSDLKVIYTSGYSPDSIQTKTRLKEGLNYLSKPYSPPRLIQTVWACVNSSSDGLAA